MIQTVAFVLLVVVVTALGPCCHQAVLTWPHPQDD